MRPLLLLFILTATTCAAAAGPHVKPPAYSFEENRGQFHQDVRYGARGRGYQLFLTPREAVLSLDAGRRRPSVLRMGLLNGSRAGRVEAIDPVETRTNYLIGSPTAWHQDIPHWARVKYTAVYPGIDLVYYGREGELEYDFVAGPGSSPGQIELALSGAQHVELTADGSLLIHLPTGTLTQKVPVAYQDIAGSRHVVDASYELRGQNRVGFRVGPYDRTRPLVIDPLLIYSTFVGGDRTDEITSVAVDKDGNTYLAGETTSSDFPSVNPLMPKPAASVHAFITKINPTGDRILYSTYLGGDSNTHADAIALDAAGNLFITGRTGARNFPLVNPVQDKQTGLNIVFVAKLNPQGDKLSFSTYLGGERNDEAYGIVLDDAGDIFIAGIANSTQFPTVNALNAKAPGGGDGFITKFSAPDYRIAYSTYFGGQGNDEIHALAVDGAGNAYVTGLTTSTTLGTKDAFQPQLKSQDAFVAKLNPDGTGIEFVTYLGGNGYERGRALKVAADATLWVGGYTTSNNFPVTANAFQSKLSGDSDAFVAQLSADGQKLLYATYLGGTKPAGVGGEDTAAIAIDSDGAVLAAGVTMSPDFPTLRKIQDFGGGKQDAFLVKFAPDDQHVVYSTFLGGSSDEIAEALAVDAGGGVYVGGQTASADYPIKGGVRSVLAGSNEGFLTKLCDPFLWASQPSLTFVHVLGRPAPEPQTFQLITCTPIAFTAETGDGKFLTISPADQKTNTQISAHVDPGSFDIGQYNDVIRISSPDAVNNPLVLPVTLIVKLPPPAIAGTGAVTELTPGMVLEISGTDLGPKAPAELTDGVNATDLAGTSATFDELPAKVLFASDAMVRVVVPDAIAGRGETILTLQYQGQISNQIKLTVAQPPVE